MNAQDKARTFPGVHADYQKAVAKKQAILAQTKPLRKQHDALVKEIHAKEREAAALFAQIDKLERPGLVDVDNELSRLDLAMGGGRLSNSTAA